MTDDYILIVTDDMPTPDRADQPGGTPRGWGDEVRKTLSNTAQVPAQVLEANMNRFLRFVGRLFRQVAQQIGTDSDMKLDEVELSIEISGRGEIKLVAGAEAKSAITLKFKRIESQP
jgi:hypothetical protein